MIRVLHAEDDPQVADLVRLQFARQPGTWDVAWVDSGRRCLQAMEAGGHDVLLLDLAMPDFDGLQVLGALTARRDPTPVIMVSGQGQHELAVRALRAGAVDCIDKNSADFRRLPEIVARVHARPARHRAGCAAPAGGHRVLYLDPEPHERNATALFFAAGAPALQLTTAAPGDVAGSPAEQAFHAVVLGPNLEPAAMLDALRHWRARDETLPVAVISAASDSATTAAAFQLGARDFLPRGPGVLTELVFSLQNALRQADTERLNAQLTRELADLNRSLAEQVAARTRELEGEVAVRRAAEDRAEENAARLQALSARLLRVQEEERRALAQELHDQVGQLLTGLRFQLEAAQRIFPCVPLEQALSVSTALLREVRELSLQLRPRLLDDLGLRPALEWQANLFHQQTGIAVDLELSLPEERLPTELETAAFRLVQEALTNVARHAGAACAMVTVAVDAGVLHVEIADRGRGFDPGQAVARHASLGLAGMAERVKLAGGTFDLFSQPGQGTRLHAEFPLPQPLAVPA